MAAHCRIIDAAIEPEEAVKAVSGPDRGAIATFAGVVRNHHAGRPVERLEYHAYEAMAERVLHDVALEAQGRFGALHVAILHRVGSLAIGDISVFVAVASAHRREALAACSFIIDRIKAAAPIWKKEFYAEGAVWIEGPDGCREGR